MVTSPNPKGSTGADLVGVACTSATNCLAVGRYFVPGKTLPVAEKWNGTKWSIVSSPSPNPSKPEALTGLACPSATDCWAVGNYFPANFSGSLTERWNGKSWSLTAS